MQWHACYSVIQLWPLCTDENTLLNLEKVTVTFISNDGKILTLYWFCRAASIRFYMLEWGEHLWTIHGLACSGRDMRMFLKPFFPVSLCASNVSEIAPRTSKSIYNTRQERLGKFIFESEARWKFCISFENNFKAGNCEWDCSLLSRKLFPEMEQP